MDRRSQAVGRGKPIEAQTAKKELKTLRVISNWAVSMGLLTGLAPIEGAKHGKSKERRPFQPREAIERTTSRGGLTPEGQAELWECLFLTRGKHPGW